MTPSENKKEELVNLWCQYVEREHIRVNADQWKVIDHLMELMAVDRNVERFFTARLTGVTFILKHFETFCREQR